MTESAIYSIYIKQCNFLWYFLKSTTGISDMYCTSRTLYYITVLGKAMVLSHAQKLLSFACNRLYKLSVRKLSFSQRSRLKSHPDYSPPSMKQMWVQRERSVLLSIIYPTVSHKTEDTRAITSVTHCGTGEKKVGSAWDDGQFSIPFKVVWQRYPAPCNWLAGS